MIGYLNVTLLGKKLKIQAKVYVIHSLRQNLLGRPEIKKFDLIREVNSVRENNLSDITNNLSDITTKFAEIFKGIGQFKKELKIEMGEDAKPFFQSAPAEPCPFRYFQN